MNTNKVFEIFKQLNQIPRASHHEEKVADFLCQYAEGLGLDYSRDKENCVVIRKPASKGCENAEPIVLLNHMDMVVVSDGSRTFDPLNDAIEAYTEEGWMKARGTSLGADNGIGLSMALAVLADETIVHPALEVLTTTNEEDGMSGAANLSDDFIKGRKVINLDSEDYDTITVGAAGAYLQKATLPISHIPAPAGLTFFNIAISGGLGGHSGVDINKGRINANYEICRLLFKTKPIAANNSQRSDKTIYLVSINGGDANASIPSNCSAVVGVKAEDAETFRQQVEIGLKKLRGQFTDGDNLQLRIEQIEPQKEVIAEEEVALLVCNLPCGVIRMRDDMPNTVMTSNNIGVIRTEKEAITISCHTRSFDDSTMVKTATKINQQFQDFGASVEIMMNTPGWQENQGSAFLKLVSQTFLDVLQFKPTPVAMHFVLEAGYYVPKYPGIQIACIGPRIIEPHSTKERVELSTIDNIYTVLVELLKRLS